MPPTNASTSAGHGDPAPKRGTKRHSTDHDCIIKEEAPKKVKTSSSTEPEARKPRLTSPDLEFDFDKSQLRDPRPTPGRVQRPRFEERDLTEDFKQRFFVSQAEKPKGRMNAYMKDQLYKEQVLLDPAMTFHDLNVCHKRGPRGKPTYDSSGFQLDYDKVAEWMRPRPYNKKRIMRGMERSLDRGERERREMFECFFIRGDEPEATPGSFVDSYVKDHISKDLGVPWHQIDGGRAREWLAKGFEKKKFSEWWREPNEEEKKRMMKMLSGASLRKDL
ncbi:hypothetical protein F4678DRAFT_257761 [Xylaria arbuscula]|nr:hypothetical protein F4678DRAFT_257761 [Xylaria arbuscula]